MKRLYTAIGLCVALLIFEALVLLPAANAKQDLVAGLLQVAAPPPPNPLVPRRNSSNRPPEFFNASKPPPDNASIADLVEYWSAIQRQRQTLGYSPDPSERTLERLFKEIEKDPAKLEKLIGSFPDGEKAADFVKSIYDREGSTGVFTKEQRKTIKDWLTYHSSYFSNDLLRLAERAGDTDTYVTNHEELLALTRVDFDKAKPLIDRMYANGPDKVSRVLARWALYRHALDTNSLGDIERYRDELKAIVSDKSLSGPMRDLAMDALVAEKEWSGRDDWYTSMMADETLADLNGYTGLTTLINVSPEEKYVDKMLELLKSENKVVRTAAVRNLLLRGNAARPEVIRAMLPWLEDPHWANDVANAREGILNGLRTVKIPESVPGLIKMLDEKKKQMIFTSGGGANMASNVVRPAGNSLARASNPPVGREVDVYAFRYSAVTALAFQADPSAGPALRRILNEMEGYERVNVIEALIKCNGFSVSEQVDAIESAVKRQEKYLAAALAAANAAVATGNLPLSGFGNKESEYSDNTPVYKTGPLSQNEIKQLLGERLLVTNEVSDELVWGLISRIESLDEREPKLAATLRGLLLKWPNSVVNVLFLRDLKNDKADVNSVTRLLAMRRVVRSQFSSDIFNARSASPTANGITCCILEEASDYDAILAGESAEAKASLLACARLIRAPLPVSKVAEFVRGTDRRLALAAERYLESEDSPEARAIVLGLHPGEAKILGATTAFFVDEERTINGLVNMLFASVNPDDQAASDASFVPLIITDGEQLGPADYHGPYRRYAPEREDLDKMEKDLREEVKKDAELIGVYAYSRQYVRIYKDRVMFSWDDDESRYRERQLNKEEFDSLKSYLADHRVDELTPFLQCGEDQCERHELLMLGRGGGRRVYTDGGTYDFFTGLDKYFAEMKQGPSVIKYQLSREIPNLEILLANDDLHAETVWKDGPDMRVAVTDKVARKKVEEDIDKAVERAEEKDNEIPEGAEMTPSQALRIELTGKREYDGISWRSVVGGNDAGPAAQPPGFDIIPNRDGAAVAPSEEQWKARTGAFEIRVSTEGVFKFAGGKLTSLVKGDFSNPVVTPNGKWLILSRPSSGEENSSTLVRINLLTNRMFPVPIDGYTPYEPKAYIASINKVLVIEQQYLYGDHEGEGEYEVATERPDTVAADPAPSAVFLLDPETGVMQPAVGETGPITHQTFRPLQRAALANEFWAAIPDLEKKSTRVGIYNTNNFGFKTLMQIPKITFNSMSMWVDEPGGKVYFVYRGHLLSLPLKK